MDLQVEIEQIANESPDQKPENFEQLFEEFIQSLEAGEIRAAEKKGDTWEVNHWVKQGVLLGFKYGENIAYEQEGSFKFFDKDTYPTQQVKGVDKNIRIVPGGSTVRTGCYIGSDVTMMPPMYVNAGAYVGDGSMIDSHALVGSCAQVGKNVHLSASAQLGGVLEPVGALPVIIEDNCLIGGNTGIYEGTQVHEGAVIGAGVVLTRATPVYDIVEETIYKGSNDKPLTIPSNAVVVPGSRPIKGNEYAERQQLSLQTPVIIKYRDESTDEATNLEDLLR